MKIRKKDGTKVSFKQFLKLWWKGIKKEMKRENKEINKLTRRYNK